MRVGACLFAGIALCAMAAPARAGEQFDMFQRFCVANHAKSGDALAAADKAGWVALPEAMMQSLSKINQIPNPQGRLRSGPQGMMILLAGTGALPDIKDAYGDVCAVMHAPGEAGLEAEAAALAAVPRDAKDSTDHATYYWRDEDSRHVPIPTRDIDAQTALKAGPINVLLEQSQDKFSLAMLVVAYQ